MILQAAVILSAILSVVIGATLWRRSPWGGERVIAAGLMVLGCVFGWIATMPHLSGSQDRLLPTAHATATPSAVGQPSIYQSVPK
ncbi:hypothetical protein STVA_19030 [Allostella vacuolata]|nr:hypothetical protein STVA_19030 [Stella vacuolata]